MKIKTVSTVLTTNTAGQVVESRPVREVAGPVQNSAGQWVDPVAVVEDASGIPVRYVTDPVTMNSVGQPVAATPVKGGGVWKLPLNAIEVDLGDSITNQGNTQNSVYDRSTLDIGFINWTQAKSGSKLLVPVGGNQGASGERIDQMTARSAAVLALSPDLVGFMGGRNDLDQGASAATLIARFDACMAAYTAKKLHIYTTLPGFGLSAFTTQQEADRQTFIAYQRAWAAARPDRVILTDCELLGIVAGDMAGDGKHPARGAAVKIGTQGAIDRAPHLANGRVIDTGYPSYVLNPILSGGTTTATSWTSTIVAGGATMTVSKDGLDRQRIQALGALGAGTSRRVDISMQQDVPAVPSMPAGAIMQAICDFDVIGPASGLVNAGFFYSMVDSGAVVLAAGQCMPTAFADPERTYEAGNYVLRSPPVVRNTGTPFRTSATFRVGFPNAGANVSVDIRINRLDIVQIG